MTHAFRVFIQNEAGACIKNRHDEKTFEHLESIVMPAPYPCPYGFVVSTTTDDGDNVDCYVLTQRNLAAGTLVDCRAIGLLEMFEGGATDHKVIAVLPGETYAATDEALDAIRRFYQAISDDFSIGALLPAVAATDYIDRLSDNGKNE